MCAFEGSVFSDKWSDSIYNEQYWWNRPDCSTGKCGAKALSFSNKCWGCMTSRERKRYRKNLLIRHRDGESLRGLNLVEVDLAGADMFGVHLEGSDMREANLEGCDLRNSNLIGVDLQNANLRGADMGWVNLKGAYLWNVHLEGADLRNACLEGAYLRYAYLQGTNFLKADLRGADLSYARVGRDVGEQRHLPEKTSEGASGENSMSKPIGRGDMRVTDLMGVKYNVHTRVFLYPLFTVGWFFRWLWKKISGGELPERLALTSFRKTEFTGVNTTELDPSKNIKLLTDIKYQQALFEFKSRSWFNRRIVYPLWGLTSYFGESLQLWLFWMVFIVWVFGLVFANNPDFILPAGERFSNPFEPYYTSAVIFIPLGMISFVPKSLAGQILVIIEVVLGFIMFASLVSFFANKFVRRERT